MSLSREKRTSVGRMPISVFYPVHPRSPGAQCCRRPFGECPLLRGKSRHHCLRSTSTGTRRVVRPSGWGVVNSLARRGCGPVVLVHTQNFDFFNRKNPLCKSCRSGGHPEEISV